MNKKKKNIATLLLLLSIFACSKEEYKPVDNIACGKEYSSHPNHQKYQAVLNKFAKNGITGLSVIISKPNNDYWAGSAGYASIEEGIKMNNCNLFQTASLAKSFIGVITLQLIEEGRLSFDTKIAQYLNNEVKLYTPNIENLTIKHLLQQTSGVPDIFDIEFLTMFMNKPEKIYTTAELLKINKGKAALYAPGTAHTYADPNFMLLSLVIDKIEGNHFESFKTRIIDHLQLNNMHYHDEGYPNIHGMTAAYWDQYNNGMVENISDLQMRITNYIIGSDGVISSPADMVHFYQSVFEGNLLSTEMLNTVKTDWVKEEHEYRMNTGYSHGFMVIEDEDGKWIGHAGHHIGASCYVFYNLENGTTIGVFTNTGTFMFLEKMELIFHDLWEELKGVTK